MSTALIWYDDKPLSPKLCSAFLPRSQRPYRAQNGGVKQQQQQVQGSYQMGGMGGASANGAQNIMLQPQPYIIQQGGMQYEVSGMQEQYFGHQHMQQGYGHPMQSGARSRTLVL